MYFLIKMWRGDIDLKRTYWGPLPFMGLIIFFYWVTVFPMLFKPGFLVHVDPKVGVTLSFIFFVFLLPTYLFWVVGVIRCVFKNKASLYGALAIISLYISLIQIFWIVIYNIKITNLYIK